jgi:hypothetical protein
MWVALSCLPPHRSATLTRAHVTLNFQSCSVQFTLFFSASACALTLA